MADRSKLAEVRNPVLALPAARRLADPSEPLTRQDIADLLADLAKDCAQRAQKSWKTHKAPMALYWKATSVYARHLSRAIRRSQHG
ncbi:hypothetical protein ACETRX_22690 [Labrys portucalensis]|uniref:Uncharacterized protein n=1 Tax=Labrys neptuniae TaxID=376174 RepID=A0ABV6ZJV1_9HYPH